MCLPSKSEHKKNKWKKRYVIPLAVWWNWKGLPVILSSRHTIDSTLTNGDAAVCRDLTLTVLSKKYYIYTSQISRVYLGFVYLFILPVILSSKHTIDSTLTNGDAAVCREIWPWLFYKKILYLHISNFQSVFRLCISCLRIFLASWSKSKKVTVAIFINFFFIFHQSLSLALL